ncbi:MAG TPA: CvpA family protein [Candidatus Saccharimonadales bacterium]|nr:CvpA family protein [Candidatus Saccharimonadales bacterium]
MIPALHGNWVDLIILVILGFFIYQGFVSGFWAILIDFLSFLGSLLVSLRLYKIAANILQSNFSLNTFVANALGYLVVAVLSEILISYLLTILIRRLPKKILKNEVTRWLGVITSLGQGLLLIAFFLILVIALPVSPNIKTDISKSRIGGYILSKTQGIEKAINNIFGPINNSLTYTTIEPSSHGSIPLDIGSLNLTIDESSENQMFNLVNNERVSRAVGALTWDTKLVNVARNYGKLMWQDHYFGHYDPEGRDVGDRLTSAGIPYNLAGENLALAPTVEIAHTGLMNSPGHRANILDSGFHKVGIGVIDNGYYGKIFVQVFTN